MDTLIIIGAKYFFFVAIIIYLVYLYKTERKKEFLIYSILSFILAYILAVIGRHLYFDPRPFVQGGYVPLVPHAPDNGFPSDHTLLVAAIASIISLHYGKVSWILWLVVAIVAISRVAAGIHHPIDIIGSSLIALFSALVVHISLRKVRVL
jgi:undecaprenyl-diphosphatase